MSMTQTAAPGPQSAHVNAMFVPGLSMWKDLTVEIKWKTGEGWAGLMFLALYSSYSLLEDKLTLLLPEVIGM